ncbi:hypothetical protein ACIS_00673 [Anaplasma centrale str. Israel]|uniref:Uncharacterized protein n=1 Tax=Anaplasma centrale (strain Israel) TaxID=574556 RepID=D1AUL9_ANACI|nr:hypothetical protein [Anaplasma centrale]ACZ49247.1 hypothetical protein ACIS_00673 [Anaplasma centrale str. Israel]
MLGFIIVTLASIAIGVKIEKIFGGYEKRELGAVEVDAESSSEKAEEKPLPSSSSGVEIARTADAGAAAIKEGVKSVLDTKSLAADVLKKLRSEGVCIPISRSSDVLAEKAVDAIAEVAAEKLRETIEVVRQVQDGSMSEAQMRSEHPKTARLLDGVKTSLARRGLSGGSTLSDTVNAVLSGGSNGQSVAGPARSSIAPITGTQSCDIENAGTCAAAAGERLQASDAGLVSGARQVQVSLQSHVGSHVGVSAGPSGDSQSGGVVESSVPSSPVGGVTGSTASGLLRGGVVPTGVVTDLCWTSFDGAAAQSHFDVANSTFGGGGKTALR